MSCISPDGCLVAIAADNILSTFWVADGSTRWSVQTLGTTLSLAFSQDGELLAAAEDDGLVLLFATVSGTSKVLLRDTRLKEMVFSPEKDFISGINTWHSRACLIRVIDGQKLWTDTQWGSNCILFLPDHSLLYGYCSRIDLLTQKALDNLGNLWETVTAASISPGDKWLAVGTVAGMHKKLYLFQAGQPGQWLEPVKLIEQDHFIWATCFSPDSTLLISGSDDLTVCIWKLSSDPEEWSCIGILYGHTQPIQQLVVLPCGKRFLSHQNDGMIRLWDISALVEGREFEIDDVVDGALVHPGWFRHGICLGGWTQEGHPFTFEYPFKLPEGVKPLDWDVENFEFPEVRDVVLENGDTLAAYLLKHPKAEPENDPDSDHSGDTSSHTTDSEEDSILTEDL